ncbi:hypothetical protein J6590_025546 [Homalodisca vitripennis]|nr:hypothetical protein J6590_025546 [Homalodisca vitripennis]
MLRFLEPKNITTRLMPVSLWTSRGSVFRRGQVREDFGRIQKLQNSVIRFISNLRGVDHISPSGMLSSYFPWRQCAGC